MMDTASMVYGILEKLCSIEQASVCLLVYHGCCRCYARAAQRLPEVAYLQLSFLLLYSGVNALSVPGLLLSYLLQHM